MRIIILFFLVFSVHIGIAQTNFDKEIIGTWQLTTEKVMDKLFNGKPDPLISVDTILKFEEENVLVILVGEFTLTAKFALKENLLTIGIREFIIVGVTKDAMIFREKNDALKTQHMYKKIKNE